MSDLKGFSLRTKKSRRGHKGSSKSAAQVPEVLDERSRYALQEKYETPGSSTEPRGAKRRERSKPGGATSDIIKKRYSIRYNQLPEFNQGDAPPLPGVPKLPQGYGQDGGRDASPAQHNRGAELRALKDTSLQAEEVVRNFLSTASEQDIAEYEKQLKKVKNRASTDLQHSVYQNRTQFIKISKEAEKLKTEMQTLRGLMSELTTTLGQSGISTGRESPTMDDAGISARKRGNRSSVVNLEALWNTQLQALWKNIEGSQKYLPALPGRHIIVEMGNWVELDAATWKPRRPVHIVLLNDHLLVATRKRKRVDPNTPVQKAPTKLVAERCWQVQDIDMMDLSSGAKEIKGPFQDMNDISNSITIRHGQESFTYRSDRPDAKDKNNLLLAFKRTLDELRRAERAEVDEMGDKSKETMNYLATRDPAISRSPNLLHSLSKSNLKDRPEVLIDVDGKQRNLRWVEGQIDELDIDIALQRFDAAVDRVEQLRKLAKGLKSNTVAQDLINVKVDERAAKLAELLTYLLPLTASHPTPTHTHITHLTRLAYLPLARTTYLSARSAVLTTRTRSLIFSGDLLAHTTALSHIYFTLIRNTISTYQTCFPAKDMSAVVVWAKGWMDRYNQDLGRGLECVERGGETWRRCVERAREMSRGLEEQGVGFGGLVGRGVDGVEEFLRGLEEGEGARVGERGSAGTREEMEAEQRGSVSRRGAVAS